MFVVVNRNPPSILLKHLDTRLKELIPGIELLPHFIGRIVPVLGNNQHSVHGKPLSPAPQGLCNRRIHREPELPRTVFTLIPHGPLVHVKRHHPRVRPVPAPFYGIPDQKPICKVLRMGQIPVDRRNHGNSLRRLHNLFRPARRQRPLPRVHQPDHHRRLRRPPRPLGPGLRLRLPLGNAHSHRYICHHFLLSPVSPEPCGRATSCLPSFFVPFVFFRDLRASSPLRDSVSHLTSARTSTPPSADTQPPDSASQYVSAPAPNSPQPQSPAPSSAASVPPDRTPCR